MSLHGILLLLNHSGSLSVLLFQPIVNPQQPNNQYNEDYYHNNQKRH